MNRDEKVYPPSAAYVKMCEARLCRQGPSPGGASKDGISTRPLTIGGYRLTHGLPRMRRAIYQVGETAFRPAVTRRAT